MYLSPEIKEVKMVNEGVFSMSGSIDNLENGGQIDWFE